MKRLTKRTKLLLVSAIAAAIYWAVFLGVAAFAINPGVGEGADLDPRSFRYQAGDFLDSHVIPILGVPFLPGAFLCKLMHVQNSAWEYVIMPVSLCLFLWVLLTCFCHAFPRR